MDPKTAPPSVAPMIDPGEGVLFCKILPGHSGHIGVVVDDEIVEHSGQSVVTTVGQLLASEDEFGEGDGIAVVLCGLSPVVVRDEFAVV